MKNILTNKKILVIITIFAIIIGFGNSVFAFSDVNFSYNNNSYSINLSELFNDYNSYSYHIIVSSDTTNVFYIGFTDNNILTTNSSHDTIVSCGIIYTFNYSTSTTISSTSGTIGLDNNIYRFVWSDTDLILNNEVVFQGAPQVQEETTILAPIVEQAETEKTMEEILGILPLVVSLLISIIAIRKAINFLKSVLKVS